MAIWLAVALIQSLFWVGVYSGLVEDKLVQFTDVCSISNISVFVMSHANFGYYIHGKSPHGAADTDMAGLLGQLQREADDLCGHRGLQVRPLSPWGSFGEAGITQGVTSTCHYGHAFFQLEVQSGNFKL